MRQTRVANFPENESRNADDAARDELIALLADHAGASFRDGLTADQRAKLNAVRARRGKAPV